MIGYTTVRPAAPNITKLLLSSGVQAMHAFMAMPKSHPHIVIAIVPVK
jgi:hypothetical protein